LLNCRRQARPPRRPNDDVSSQRQRRRPLRGHSASLSLAGGSGQRL